MSTGFAGNHSELLPSTRARRSSDDLRDGRVPVSLALDRHVLQHHGAPCSLATASNRRHYCSCQSGLVLRRKPYRLFLPLISMWTHKQLSIHATPPCGVLSTLSMIQSKWCRARFEASHGPALHKMGYHVGLRSARRGNTKQ